MGQWIAIRLERLLLSRRSNRPPLSISRKGPRVVLLAVKAVPDQTTPRLPMPPLVASGQTGPLVARAADPHPPTMTMTMKMKKNPRLVPLVEEACKTRS
jgi:hypothetical protein